MEPEDFSKDEFKERQIIPATGWRAVYLNPDTNEIRVRPMICFALIKHLDSGDHFVDGMTTDFEDRSRICPAGALSDSCDFVFVGFIGANETPEEAIEDFRKLIQKEFEEGESE